MQRLLIAVVSACVLGLVSGPAHADGKKPHQFAGAVKCRSCHEKDEIGNQYGKWLDSKHAKAWSTLASDKAKEWGKKRGIDDPQASDKCVKCHVAAHGEPKPRLSMKYSPKEGVTCEACHGPGSDYRKKKIMMNQDEAVKRGLDPADREGLSDLPQRREPGLGSRTLQAGRRQDGGVRLRAGEEGDRSSRARGVRPLEGQRGRVENAGRGGAR